MKVKNHLMNQKNELLLRLTLGEGIGPATIQRLLDGLEYQRVTIEALQSLTTAGLLRFGLSELQATTIYNAIRDDRAYQRECVQLEKYGVQLVTLFDEYYPELLRHIPYPPAVLYVSGTLEVLTQRSFAFVGARKGDIYGKKAVSLLVPPLIDAGITIVSGGARGIDSFAHQAALNNGGKTIAVLGSGLLQPYPRENMRMFEQIAQSGGALVSPFPLMMQPHPGNFPARNRIISGLSEAVVIVQGERKSGAGITATYALEQGKTIYAVPGAIDSTLSQLPHYLIGQGAILCDGPSAFGFETKIPSIKANDMPQSIGEQLLVLCKTPQTFEQLQQELKLAEDELHQLLFELQCSAKIQQDFVGRYRAQVLG